jgi:hypothetical protein
MKSLTDFEKLLFAESYIEELKANLQEHKDIGEKAVSNLKTFIADVRASGKSGAKLMSYKQEMQDSHKKNRKLNIAKEKLEHKNYLLRVKIRELENK